MRKTSIQVVKEPVCSRSEEAKSKSQGGIWKNHQILQLERIFESILVDSFKRAPKPMEHFL